MSKVHRIQKSILTHVQRNSVLYTDYSNWYVGITANPPKRNSEHGNPSYWKAWLTDHPNHARDMEKQLLSLGFKGGPGGGRWPRWVRCII